MTDGPFTEPVCAELERISEELIEELRAIEGISTGHVYSAINEAFLFGDAPRWQPIKTAPKDGTVVLVSGPTHQTVGDMAYVDFAFFGDAGWESPRFRSNFFEPTHWKPRPSPPEVTS